MRKGTSPTPAQNRTRDSVQIETKKVLTETQALITAQRSLLLLQGSLLALGLTHFGVKHIEGGTVLGLFG